MMIEKQKTINILKREVKNNLPYLIPNLFVYCCAMLVFKRVDYEIDGSTNFYFSYEDLATIDKLVYKRLTDVDDKYKFALSNLNGFKERVFTQIRATYGYEFPTISEETLKKILSSHDPAVFEAIMKGCKDFYHQCIKKSLKDI